MYEMAEKSIKQLRKELALEVLKSITLWIISMFLMLPIHEFGHWLSAELLGFDACIVIASPICWYTLIFFKEELTLFQETIINVSGGLFAGLTLLLLASFTNNEFTKTPLLTFAMGELAGAVIEGLYGRCSIPIHLPFMILYVLLLAKNIDERLY